LRLELKRSNITDNASVSISVDTWIAKLVGRWAGIVIARIDCLA
jgi:hypothetical protein